MAALVAVIVAPAGADWLRRFADRQPTGNTVALLVATGLGIAYLLPQRVLGVGRLRYALAYPPTWTAIVLGFLLATGYLRACPLAWRAAVPGEFAEQGARILFAAGNVVIGLVAGGVALAQVNRLWVKRLRYREPRQDPTTNLSPLVDAGGKSKSIDAKRLISRLLDDAAIGGVADDWFGRAAVAARVARRLSDSPMPAVAIIGPLGSGKTSLRKLVEEALAARPSAFRNVRLVVFSAWPYETVGGVVAGMLRSVVDALGDELGTPVLGWLPDRYVQAIEGLVDRWGRLLGLLVQQLVPTPEAILREVEIISAALGFRVVLWVEDLERFGAGVEAEAESAAVRERLAPVRALLYQLQELRSVSVVIAATSLNSGFDLEKLARYIEVLEPIATVQARAVLDVFRTEILQRAAADGVVDASSLKVRESYTLSCDRLDAVESALLIVGTSLETRWGPALTAISTTPRALKQGLRSCMEIWNEYRGELDFDHLMGASILRHAQPAAFATVVSLADRLRAAQLQSRAAQLQSPDSRRQGSVEQPPWEELSDVLQKTLPNTRVATAVNTIVRALFARSEADHPQGFQRVGRTDYWRRYLSQPEIPAADLDQPMLRAIRLFTEQTSPALTDLITDDERCAQLEWFESILEPQCVLRLLDDALQRSALLATHPQNEPPGGTRLWRIALDRAQKERTWSEERFAELLSRHIKKNVPSKLSLVYVIFAWYASPSEHQRDLLRDEDRVALRAEFVCAFMSLVAGKPEVLSRALTGSEGWLLARLAWGPNRAGQPRTPLPWPEWPAFAPTVVAAARSDPEVLLAPLAELVARRTETFDEDGSVQSASQFLPEVCARLFGEVDVVALFRGVSDVIRERANPGTPLRVMIELAESSEASSAAQMASGSE